MKLLGLLGGMSFESTLPYYREINQRMAQRLGGLHSARLLLYSVDFHDIAALQREARWDEAGAQLAACARVLQAGGACSLFDPNLNEQPATARPPPDIPVKRKPIPTDS